MTDMMTTIETKENMTKKQIPAEWKKVCNRTEQVLDVMKQQYSLYKNDLHWKNKLWTAAIS